jgi:phosphoglycerate dehydrogenase-like enzyme
MWAKGITICYTEGGANGAGTAELALGLMLAAARGIPKGDAAIRSGRFQNDIQPGIELEGCTLGLVGLGRIGMRMARYGSALGMKCIAWSPNLDAERAAAGGAVYASKEGLLRAADVVSLHIVLSETTRGIIGEAELALMRPGAVLVNTSRGPLIDEAALVASLHKGTIIAALDVFDREPLPTGHPLAGAPNTVLTPHLGYGTWNVFTDFYEQSVENARAFLEGYPVRVLTPGP